jgi:hypothetical protein
MSKPARAVVTLVPTIPEFCLIWVAASAVFVGCSASQESKVAEERLVELQLTLQRIEEQLAAVRQSVPPQTEQRLKKLEGMLMDPTQWPHSADEAEKLRLELDSLVQTMPPLAVAQMMPELVRLNWGVESVWNLRMYANAKESELEGAQANIQDLLDRHPQGYFDELQKKLDARRAELKPQFRRFQLSQLLQRANLALQDKEDAAEVYSSLDEYRGEQEVDSIATNLRAKALEKTLDGLEERLKKAASLSNDRSRQVGLLTVQDNLVRLIADLELDAAPPKETIADAKILLAKCDREVAQLADKQAEAYASKLRRYQAWALEQIRGFDGPNGSYYDIALPWVQAELSRFKHADKDEEWLAIQRFPSIKDLMQEKLAISLSDMEGAMLTATKRREIYNQSAEKIGWKNNIDTEIAYRTTRDGMVQFLLPIHPNLLDPPVAQLYQQAFAKGWQKLEGREDQLFVAQQSAVVKKKSVEDVAAASP